MVQQSDSRLSIFILFPEKFHLGIFGEGRWAYLRCSR